MLTLQTGYVYILSNLEYPNKYKIGKTKDNPIIRAKTLTKQTGTLGEFKVEWNKKVPEMNIAELILHYKFADNHYDKEFFEFDLNMAKVKSDLILDEFFKDEYKIDKLLKAKRKAKELKEKLRKL